ncbi:MAG: hypothetical protein ACRDGN_17230 [bacterium]
MALKIAQVTDQAPGSGLRADRRLWITAGGNKVVEDGDLAAAFLLAGEGATIPQADVDRLALALVHGKVQQRAPGQAAPPAVKQSPRASKRARQPKNKMLAPSADKAAREGGDISRASQPEGAVPPRVA